MASREEIISAIEKKTGIPEGLFVGLKDEDDWSFVIKLHTLIETAVAFAITTALDKPELGKVIDKLNIGGRTGKLTFAKAIQALSPEEIAYVDELSELRNVLAHKIQNVGMTLADHVATLKGGQRWTFFKTAMAFTDEDMRQFDDRTVEALLGNPKALLWNGAIQILGAAYYQDQQTELKRIRAELHEFYYKAYGNEKLGALKQMQLANLFSGKPQAGLLDFDPDKPA